MLTFKPTYHTFKNAFPKGYWKASANVDPTLASEEEKKLLKEGEQVLASIHEVPASKERVPTFWMHLILGAALMLAAYICMSKLIDPLLFLSVTLRHEAPYKISIESVRHTNAALAMLGFIQFMPFVLFRKVKQK